MKLKNNSINEWLNYNCGDGVIVDIKANSVFDIDDKSGKYLLRLLGHPNWITEVTDISDKEEIKKNVFCEICGSKGYRHKNGCEKVSQT